MFLIANNGIITMNSGDSFCVPLFINAGSALHPVRYKLKENDKLYFGVAESNQRFSDSIICKTFTDLDLNEYGDVIVKFCPDDTLNLLPGTYWYEVKLLRTNAENTCCLEQIDTVVKRTKFVILE